MHSTLCLRWWFKRHSHVIIESTEKMKGSFPPQTEKQMEIKDFDSSLRAKTNPITGWLAPGNYFMDQNMEDETR